MKKMAALIIMLSVLAFSAPLASAADSGWYAGAGGGASRYKGDGSDFAPLLPGEVLTTTNLQDTSTGWKLFAGKQFNENWAVEFAYTSFGKFSRNSNVTGGVGGTGVEYSEVRPECWSLSALGILPLGNNFSLLGRAGVCQWEDGSNAFETIGPVIVPETPQTTGTNLTFGLGARYDFTNNWGMRIEWERFQKIIHNTNGVDLYSASLQYGF
jgi:OOP family OmpA-OmpF porin